MPDARIRAPWIAAALAAGDAVSWPRAAEASRRPTRPAARSSSRSAAAPATSSRTPGTKGVQGPNLDLAFKQSVADGLGRSTIAGRGQEADRPAPGQSDAGRPGRGRRRGRGGGLRGERDREEGLRRRPAGPSGTAKADAKNTVADPDRPERPARVPVQERRGEGRQGHDRVAERLLGAARHRARGRARGRRRPGRQDLDDHREPEARQARRSTAASPATSRPG